MINMTLYILDTDHLSLYGRNDPSLIERLQTNSVILTTTAINVEEQLRGRLAQVAEAKVGISLANSYRWLSETVKLLSDF
jgi:tRNA(fMet)-specific endonuclease VapC